VPVRFRPSAYLSSRTLGFLSCSFFYLYNARDSLLNHIQTQKCILIPSLYVTLVLLTLSGCVPTTIDPTGISINEKGQPPVMEPPPPQKKVLLKVHPEALPEGARAQFPAYDGNLIFVTLPARVDNNVTAQTVAKDTIAPILKAMGFERGGDALKMPPSQGVKMQKADFKVLAEAIDYEYQSHPEFYRPKTQAMLDVFLGKKNPYAEINEALEIGEGMDFNQYVANIEREEILFPFQQVEGDVPIEHTMLMASHLQGQSITTVRGILFNNYSIANKIDIGLKDPAVQTAIKMLSSTDGIDRVISKDVKDGPHLLLLPFGTNAAGITQLRYSCRMILKAVSFGTEGYFLLWLDAETGNILKLHPLFDNVTATGQVYRRDPGVGTHPSYFKVDPATGGNYILKLEGLINQLDYLGDGDTSNDLSIPDNTNASTSTQANFDQAPINDSSEALCYSGSNKAFQQVQFMSTLYRQHRRVQALGVYRPFPKFGGIPADLPEPWNPTIEETGFCNANSTMRFGACEGYFNSACPDFSGPFMNLAHDNTVIAHELGHNITSRLSYARPSNWCGYPGCPVSVSWRSVHDLADAWADHLESTNCTAGWAAKNAGGIDNGLNCSQHSEGAGLPRLHTVTVPFDPNNPEDHFPEHRSLSTEFYANGQIAAAALWQVRLGMRSKCRTSGTTQFGVRLTRAIKNSGFLGYVNAFYDLGLYRQINDLQLSLTDQWATAGSTNGAPAFRHNGSHTTNKVASGFARAGLFLIPPQCLDGDPHTGDEDDPATGHFGFCPTSEGGENGGDAVIDIDDNDTGDDLTIDGVSHPEHDFLEQGGSAPTFHVWTGPRYRFDDPDNNATYNNPAPCNSWFQVEVSTHESFPPASTLSSPWTPVDMDLTTPTTPECYGTWKPTPAEWTTLQVGGLLSRIYYRAKTQDDTNSNKRLSTRPGKGLWIVPPPYAVLTHDGQSDY
jgi:hypothetical protein